MTIVGFKINKINAEYKQGNNKEIEVKSVPKITNVEKADVKSMKNVLKLDYDFETTYDPDVGSIKISGYVLLQSEDADKILDMWKSKKLMEAKMAEEALNFILRKCLIKVTSIADDLSLPPAVRLPIIKAKKSGASEKKE